MEHKSKTVTVNTILTQTEIKINLSWETHETLVSASSLAKGYDSGPPSVERRGTRIATLG